MLDCCCCCCGWLIAVAMTIAAYKWLDSKYRAQRITGLESRHVLITGCDTGFGNLAAKQLDGLGCHVFAGCLTEAGQDELRKSCSSRLKTVSLNIANHDSVTKAFATVKATLPPGKGLWGLINNAGMLGRKLGPVEWLTLQDYSDVIAVNLLGTIDVTTTFLPLIKQERGRIVNTASIAGRFAMQGLAAYNISKYGVEAFNDTLRREMVAFGVSVHVMEPGFFKTNLTLANVAALQAAWDQTPDSVRQQYGEHFFTTVRDSSAKMTDKLNSPRLNDVTDAYEHALFSTHPRARYVIGNDARFLILPLLWLPEWLSDKLCRLAMTTPPPAGAVR